jgi:hypothetical protein
VDKARRNEEIDELAQLKRANSMRVQLARFVAYHNNLEAMPKLEIGDQLDHSRIRFRLGEHKRSKLRPAERPFLVKDHQAQVLLECELSLFMDLESHSMPRFHRRPSQLEVGGRASAGEMVPPVREQDTADIYKRASDLSRILHRFFPPIHQLNQLCSAARQETIKSTRPTLTATLLT